MVYVQCKNCNKEIEDVNVFGNKVEHCIWCDEPIIKNLKNSKKSEYIVEKVEQDIRKGIETAFSWFKIK